MGVHSFRVVGTTVGELECDVPEGLEPFTAAAREFNLYGMDEEMKDNIKYSFVDVTDKTTPTSKASLYDEMCKLLTDYEGNGSDIPVEIEDFYNFLVRLQSHWETIIT